MQSGSPDIRKFRRIIQRHYRRHGRDLPWRRTRNPYRIVLSELMLQQTQVSRVKKFYPKFLRRFPTARALAGAPLAEVLSAWQGLGYNRRAIFLQKIARRAEDEHRGAFPSDPEILAGFPGIGTNTAGAIAAFAFNRPAVFIETNIRRAYIHYFFPRRKKIADAQLLLLIEKTLDRKNPRAWYYALMDYGAMLGRLRQQNPNRRSRHYARQSRFEGSDRQVSAQIVRLFLKNKHLTPAQIAGRMGEPPDRVQIILSALEKKGFITRSKSVFKIA